MDNDAGVAQAQKLLTALNQQINDISQKLEVIEARGRHQSVRGALCDQKQRNELRRDLYEAHRHIDGLYRRFPETRPHRRDGSDRHVTA